MNPKHSISLCPICGGGLCGIRVCLGPLHSNRAGSDAPSKETPRKETPPGDDPMSDGPSPNSHGWQRPHNESPTNHQTASRHGLVVCDECEAIWLSPDTDDDHRYPDPEDARCPICHDPLWGQASHWASMVEIDALGWVAAVNHKLDFSSDEGAA